MESEMQEIEMRYHFFIRFGCFCVGIVCDCACTFAFASTYWAKVLKPSLIPPPPVATDPPPILDNWAVNFAAPCRSSMGVPVDAVSLDKPSLIFLAEVSSAILFAKAILVGTKSLDFFFLNQFIVLPLIIASVTSLWESVPHVVRNQFRTRRIFWTRYAPRW